MFTLHYYKHIYKPNQHEIRQKKSFDFIMLSNEWECWTKENILWNEMLDIIKNNIICNLIFEIE